MRIGLFIPCYIDAFFPEVGVATLELLERLGHEVVYPLDQTCCGQYFGKLIRYRPCHCWSPSSFMLRSFPVRGPAPNSEWPCYRPCP